VLGGLAGIDGLPARHIGPLQNRIATSLPGLDGVEIDDLARRTFALLPAHSVHSQRQGRS
jgi:hypothetical protein